MGFFDLFKTPQSNSAKSSPNINISVTVDGKSYVNGMSSQPKNPNFEARIRSHNEKLMLFYNEQSKVYAYGQDVTDRLIKQISPNANANTCPYCGVIHPFNATRARKCPACGNKMIVRSGTYLKEQDIKNLESLSQEYYDKAQNVERLKSVLQNVQDNKLSCNYGRCFLYIAEAYDCCAVIHNQSYESGFTNWDYAWGVLNKDALDTVAAVSRSQQDVINNGYGDIAFARGMHLLRELKHSTSDKSRARYAKIAISIFLEYLYDLAKSQLSDWHEEETPKLVQVALKLGKVNPSWIDEAAAHIVERSNSAADRKYMDEVVATIKDYALVESDPERLKWLIY